MARATNRVIGELELSALLRLWGEDRGWRSSQSPMASDLTSYAYEMRPPKNPTCRGSEGFQVGENVEVLGGGHTWRGQGLCAPSPCLIL